MAGYHTVAQGEHLSSIASQYGFADYQTIWNDPNNAGLKQQRGNPNVLFPGDQLYIPDKESKSYSKSTDAEHDFKVNTTPLTLRVQLGRRFSQPVANTPCDFVVDADKASLTSDGDGKLERPIPKPAKTAVLLVHDKIEMAGKSVPNDFEVPLRIGNLDPVEELSGQIGRLNNLGYDAGPLDGTDQDRLNSAIEEFQCDQKLQVDGICGPATQQKLKTVHGS